MSAWAHDLWLELSVESFRDVSSLRVWRTERLQITRCETSPNRSMCPDLSELGRCAADVGSRSALAAGLPIQSQLRTAAAIWTDIRRGTRAHVLACCPNRLKLQRLLRMTSPRCVRQCLAVTSPSVERPMRTNRPTQGTSRSQWRAFLCLPICTMLLRRLSGLQHQRSPLNARRHSCLHFRPTPLKPILQFLSHTHRARDRNGSEL